jgi:sulfate adenylyltransferase subunit 2
MNLASEARILRDATDTTRRRSHLDWLESEAVHILREGGGGCPRPGFVFSGGKKSAVGLRQKKKKKKKKLFSL